MKYLSVLLTCLSVMLYSTAKADLTGIVCYDAHQGAFRLQEYSWGTNSVENHEYQMNMNGTFGTLDYYDNPSSWGGLDGVISATDAEDPVLTQHFTLVNDSGYGWIGFIVEVSMGIPFGLSNAVVNVPLGWGSVISGPTLVGPNYVGTITYSGGPVVNDGDPFDFQFQMGFTGALNYPFTLTFTPVAVPEPGSLSLIMVSGLLFGWWVKRKNRT